MKELHSIVDYSRSPETSNSPAINSFFSTTEIADPDGEPGQYPYFWSSTTHQTGPVIYDHAAYIAFGKAQGQMIDRLLDVHGAGAQRSDPKSGDADDYPIFFGPQGDVQYVFNYVRCVRNIESTSIPSPSNTSTPTPEVTPTLDDNDGGKLFTFKCRHNSIILGNSGVFEKMTLELGDNEQCTVTLTNFEPGVPIELTTFMRTGRNTSIQVSPESRETDPTGQMEFTISAITKGTDWITWAVRNDVGEFEFSKRAYDNGTACGMFVDVK